MPLFHPADTMTKVGFELGRDVGNAVGNLLLLASKNNLKQTERDAPMGIPIHHICHPGTLDKVSPPQYKIRHSGCVNKGTSREPQGYSSQLGVPAHLVVSEHAYHARRTRDLSPKGHLFHDMQ